LDPADVIKLPGDLTEHFLDLVVDIDPFGREGTDCAGLPGCVFSFLILATFHAESFENSV
jgi:hypothetical protein